MSGHGPQSGGLSLRVANVQALKHGITEGLTGLFLSGVLSAMVVIGLFYGWAPFKFVERLGIDASFFLLSNFPQSGWAPAGRFVFLDIDVETCKRLPPATGDCGTRNLVTSAVLQELMPFLVKTKAKAIVVASKLDLDASDDAKSIDRLIQLSTTTPGSPPILIAMELRIENGVPASFERNGESITSTFRNLNAQWFDPYWLAEKRLYESNVRPVPVVFSSDADADDGKIRFFQRLVSINTGHGYLKLPNLPYVLTNLVGRGSLRELDARFYLPPNANTVERPDHSEMPVRFRYGIPALSQRNDVKCSSSRVGERPPAARCEDFRNLTRLLTRLFVYAPTKDLFDEGAFDYDSASLSGSVVIIGSSAPSVGDLHRTPIGPMSGVEVIINAAHSMHHGGTSFELSTQLPNNLGLAIKVLVKKIWYTLLPAAIFTLTFVLINLINANARHFFPPWRQHIALPIGTAVILTVAALILCLKVELDHSVAELYGNSNGGYVTDTLAPIIVLLFERYIEASKAILVWLGEHIDMMLEEAAKSVALWFSKR